MKLEELINDLSTTMKTHMGIEEVTSKALSKTIEQMSMDIKDQRKHFDEKISDCNEAITDMLKEEYVTESEIHAIKDATILEQTKIRTAAIEAAKKDILSRVKSYAGLVAGTVTLLLTILAYIIGLK